jgi:predicted amidohydrolase
MRIALAQTNARLGDVDANLDVAARHIDDGLAEGADLIVFPELNLTGYAIGDVDEDLAVEVGDPRLTALAERAGTAGLVLGFPEISEGLHVYNSCAYFEGGRLLHVHRKLYLPTYDIFEERKAFSPGQDMRAFPTRHGRMALLTCNDAWQPQLAFVAVQDAARVLLVPAASARARPGKPWDAREYWRDITRFYARMFQTFVVFVNRAGDEGELQFWGGSHVYDPWGNLVAEAPLGEEARVTVDLDLDAVRRRRREIPLLKEARLGLLERELRRLVEAGGDL